MDFFIQIINKPTIEICLAPLELFFKIYSLQKNLNFQN